MEIVVNGESLSCADDFTVQALLIQLGFLPESIVVERNDQFVQRSTYSTTVLRDGDTLHLIEFVGGG